MIPRRSRGGLWPVALGALLGAAGCVCHGGHRPIAPFGYAGRCDRDPAACQRTYQRQCVHPTLPQPVPTAYPTPVTRTIPEAQPINGGDIVPPPDDLMADLTAPVPQRGHGLPPYPIAFQSGEAPVRWDVAPQEVDPVQLLAPEPIEDIVPPPPSALEPIEPAHLPGGVTARPLQAEYRIARPPLWDATPSVRAWPCPPATGPLPVITPGCPTRR